MAGLLHKIRNLGRILFSLPASLWFNFKYFPFQQAIRLPVILYRPKISGNGKYILPANIHTGMIRMGFPAVSVFQAKGVVLENRGEVRFLGSALLGGGSAVSVGEKGKLEIGDRFANQAGGKLICYHSITLGYAVRLGWESIVCDTDFHTMKSEDGTHYTKGFGPIEIGERVWIGSFCKIFKNSKIPHHCTLASNTLISKAMDCRPYSLIYQGDELKAKYTGYFRDLDDDTVVYE